MTKENIAKHIARVIWLQHTMTRSELEDIILRELTDILHADKGRLTKGTIVK